mmetsp:Transcript_33968/g.95509  ORF Transcript_33968/g.95509 Transcript_33968/m.95509 type:complete len:284 (-) Transcript_33968:2231-3082(-)
MTPPQSPSKSKSSSSESSSSSSPVSGLLSNFCRTRSILSSSSSSLMASSLSDSSSLPMSSLSLACFSRSRMISRVCVTSCATRCGTPGARAAGKDCAQLSWNSRRKPRTKTFRSGRPLMTLTCCIHASKTCCRHCRSSVQRRNASTLYQSIVANAASTDLRKSAVSAVCQRLHSSSKYRGSHSSATGAERFVKTAVASSAALAQSSSEPAPGMWRTFLNMLKTISGYGRPASTQTPVRKASGGPREMKFSTGAMMFEMKSGAQPPASTSGRGREAVAWPQTDW